MKYSNILFDLDGTLTDPKEGITNSVAYALHSFGIEVEDNDTLCPFIGPPLSWSFHEYYGFDSDKSQKAIKVYREYFSVHGLYENSVYDGIPELLGRLKVEGCRLFVATSKPEKFARTILTHFGLADYFDEIRGIKMDEEHIEKPEVIRRLMDGFALDRADTLMVGDRRFDIEGAKANGIDSMGVLYGYGDRQELESAGATHITASVKSLSEFFGEN